MTQSFSPHWTGYPPKSMFIFIKRLVLYHNIRTNNSQPDLRDTSERSRSLWWQLTTTKRHPRRFWSFYRLIVTNLPNFRYICARVCIYFFVCISNCAVCRNTNLCETYKHNHISSFWFGLEVTKSVFCLEIPSTGIPGRYIIIGFVNCYHTEICYV